MRVKIARRFQITIPEEVRKELGLNVGDSVDVRREGRKVIVEKVGNNWESVMRETRGTWKNHPVFGSMKDSLEIADWIRQKKRQS
jgi:AbrB family looped-hinge helix DNA binding protein